MRKIFGAAFISLDGVVQASGGPDEDTTGGFAHGGWMEPIFDEGCLTTTRSRQRGGGDEKAAAQGFMTEAPRARLTILPGTSHVGIMAEAQLIADFVTPFTTPSPSCPPASSMRRPRNANAKKRSVKAEAKPKDAKAMLRTYSGSCPHRLAFSMSGSWLTRGFSRLFLTTALDVPRWRDAWWPRRCLPGATSPKKGVPTCPTSTVS